MSAKPKLFIGSSVESLDIADAVNLNLDHDIEVTIWRNGTFDLSSSTIDSLVNKAQSIDFALFIFSPDDMAVIKDQKKPVVRDNVVFELGLFIGSIGKERCFILKPRNVDLHLPTDLLGVTLADYEPHRSDGDLASAVNHACVLMKKRMKELERRVSPGPDVGPPKLGVDVGGLKDEDYRVLRALISTATSTPDGYTIRQIKHDINSESYIVDLAIIRLEKLGYVQRHIESDQWGNNYYAYSITSNGLDLMLQSEDHPTMLEPQEHPTHEPVDENDIPF